MQAVFKISGRSAEDQARQMIEMAVEDTYGIKGRGRGYEHPAAHRPGTTRPHHTPGSDHTIPIRPPVPAGAPGFVQDVTAEIIAGRGDWLPVSKMPVDGTFPTATTQYEKRNIATEIPVWDPAACIQCNQCAFVCPHATIRMKVYPAEFANGNSPLGWQTMEAKGRGWEGMKYTLQVAPEDCTGCGVCVETCPAYAKDASGQKTERKAINMAPLTDRPAPDEAANGITS